MGELSAFDMAGVPRDVRHDSQGAAEIRPQRRLQDLHGFYANGDAGVRRSAHEAGHVSARKATHHAGSSTKLSELSTV